MGVSERETTAGVAALGVGAFEAFGVAALD